ncbi:MAG: hypothetical protein EOP32_02940 [Rhodococcus sp. (in: high G+C Gram-positive bacteria)]|nr:MAG: hypothetical protein EOP32_02940 [Rhodococcus sp. (in: high G+C Gram-positive bacteria)]
MNPQEYRRWRQRRHADWTEVHRKRKHPDKDSEFLINFAAMWAPYGGAAEEEILAHFGMTTRRFIDRLWQLVSESNCDQEEIRSLASAYPTIGQRNGS